MMNSLNCCVIPPRTYEIPVCPKPIYRYIQPKVRSSCKPHYEFQKPLLPMDFRTIYKTSFLDIKPDEAIQCRLAPAKPIVNLRAETEVKMEKQTVTSLSYPGHFFFCKQPPSIPNPRSLLGEGPMQDLTTQKHDYVAKPICRRMPILPSNKMIRTDFPSEQATIHKLSFPKPDLNCFSPAISCKPHVEYRKPEVPMDTGTTQKLSYLPVCLQPKECFPWSKKPRFCMPCVPMETKTTQTLSYPPPGDFITIGESQCPCNPDEEQQFPKANEY